jgi:hypothetical protein
MSLVEVTTGFTTSCQAVRDWAVNRAEMAVGFRDSVLTRRIIPRDKPLLSFWRQCPSFALASLSSWPYFLAISLSKHRQMPNPLSPTIERLRLLAMMLALLTGIVLISQLWLQPLDRNVLMSAGRGVIFILLALGLMGSGRLSLMLTALLCAVTVANGLRVNNVPQFSDGLELLMLVLCAGLLLAPESTARAESVSL